MLSYPDTNYSGTVLQGPRTQQRTEDKNRKSASAKTRVRWSGFPRRARSTGTSGSRGVDVAAAQSRRARRCRWAALPASAVFAACIPPLSRTCSCTGGWRPAREHSPAPGLPGFTTASAFSASSLMLGPPIRLRADGREGFEGYGRRATASGSSRLRRSRKAASPQVDVQGQERHRTVSAFRLSGLRAQGSQHFQAVGA